MRSGALGMLLWQYERSRALMSKSILPDKNWMPAPADTAAV